MNFKHRFGFNPRVPGWPFLFQNFP